MIPGQTLTFCPFLAQVQRAVAAALFAYIVAGIAGPLAIYAQQRMAWADALWLAAGAIPGAAGGAVAVGYISAIIIKSVLYAVVLLSALFSLYRLWSERQKKRSAASEIADTAGDQVATPMAGPGDAGEVLSSQTAERQAPADPDPTLAVSSSKDPRAASLAQSAEATLQTSAETEPLHGQTDAQVEFDRWSVTTTRYVARDNELINRPLGQQDKHSPMLQRSRLGSPFSFLSISFPNALRPFVEVAWHGWVLDWQLVPARRSQAPAGLSCCCRLSSACAGTCT